MPYPTDKEERQPSQVHAVRYPASPTRVTTGLLVTVQGLRNIYSDSLSPVRQARAPPTGDGPG